ncbi:MAG: transglycosylase family protein [Actinopolymorphaceae bacterium]
MPYKAKHRGTTRRRKAAKKVTRTAALTGVVAAVPMVGLAAPAHAATDDTWNQLSQCESSGDWSINTGNGYYGGVQFAGPTWREFGGTKYASRADLATRAEQIAIAEKVLDVQGWNAWPSCSRQLGLDEGDKAGSAGSPDGTSATKSKQQTQVRTDPRTRASRSVPKSTSTRKTAAGSYTVRPGDTLSSIARANRVPGGWRALWKINRSVVQDPNLIFPDDRLRLGGKAKPADNRSTKKQSARDSSADRSSRSSDRTSDQAAKGWTLPLQSYNLTARFGQSGNNWSSSHHGLDFGASSGSQVRAVGAGRIVSAGWDGAYGNRIKVRHADGTVTLYAHMSRFAQTSGDVSAGTVIGYVGATGNATGPHLHLEVRPNGGGLDTAIDPYAWLESKGLRP